MSTQAKVDQVPSAKVALYSVNAQTRTGVAVFEGKLVLFTHAGAGTSGIGFQFENINAAQNFISALVSGVESCMHQIHHQPTKEKTMGTSKKVTKPVSKKTGATAKKVVAASTKKVAAKK